MTGGMNTMQKLYVWLRSLLQGEEGQTLAEYALIIALVAILLIAGLGTLTDALDGVFAAIAAGLAGS